MSIPEVIKYQDPKSLLVIGEHGQLRQLFVPFKVKCVQPLEHIPANTWVYVEAVFLHPRHRLIYWINQRLYPYDQFRIEVHY